MANLLELSRAAQSLKVPTNHSLLIYGDPKSGKTRLAVTVVRIPQVRRVYFFDGENGSDTLLSMVRTGILTEEQAQKVTLIKVFDSPEHPYFIETVLKCVVVGKACRVCSVHGRVECPACVKDKAVVATDWTPFNLGELGHNDWVVIDTGSQLANSAMASLTKGWAYSSKPGFDEYGPQGRMLTDVMTVIQSAPTNFIMVTHQCVLKEATYAEDTSTSTGKATSKQSSLTNEVKFYPLVGTKNFSLNVAKFFGTVIYTDMRMKKHVAGSSSTYNSDMITGSRIDIVIEKAASADLSLVLPQAGLYQTEQTEQTQPETKTQTEIEVSLKQTAKD